MFSSILVPVDGSGPADRAVGLALQVARATGARLWFVNVISDSEIVLDAEAPLVNPQARIDVERSKADALLSAAAATAKASGVQADIECVEGEPIDRIVAFATERGCDLIAMGTHGRSGLARLLLGSVTEGVLRHSHVPVLCIREEPQHDEGSAHSQPAPEK